MGRPKVQQHFHSVPPDMYETSGESTSGSGSWSTSGSRRVPSKQHQEQRQSYQHRRGNSNASSSPTSTDGFSSSGGVTRAKQYFQQRQKQQFYQEPVVDESHSWTPSPQSSSRYVSAASKLSSRYRQDYSRSQHPSGVETTAADRYSSEQTTSLRRQTKGHPVSEPNFGSFQDEAIRFVNRFDQTHSPVEFEDPSFGDDAFFTGKAANVSDKIQHYNSGSNGSISGSSPAFPDPVFPDNDFVQEKQRSSNRARELAHRYESTTRTSHLHDFSQQQWSQKPSTPRHKLNHAAGGDVYPRPEHQDAHYDKDHEQDVEGDDRYHHTSESRHAATTEDDLPHQISDDTIETPSITSVTELRRRLWDEQESLQVAIKPSLHEHGDAHPQHWMHFYGPEMAGRQGQRMLSPGERQKRVTRSLSPARPQYRRQQQRQPSTPQSHKKHFREEQQQQEDEFVPQDGAGPMFKTKFYQAAVKARRGSSRDPPSKSTSRHPQSNTEPEGHWVHSPQSMQESESSRALKQGHDEQQLQQNTSSSSSPRTTPQIERVLSSDRTNGGSEESSVARLVAQLNAVNRNNPEKALEKIDSILRAESRSSGGTAGGGTSPNPLRQGQTSGENQKLQKNDNTSFFPQVHEEEALKQDTTPEPEETSDEDSDDETSVSSITNPTYSNKVDAEHPVPALETTNFRRYRPNFLQMYSPPPATRKPQTTEPVRGKSSSKKKPKGPPPPETIRVASPKENKDTTLLSPLPNSDEEVDSSTADILARTASQEQELSATPNIAKSNTENTAASIALKIQQLDDISNRENDSRRRMGSPSPSGASETALSTVNTEDLGSLMTPADAGNVGGTVMAASATTESLGSLMTPADATANGTATQAAPRAIAPPPSILNRRKTHPWDNKVPKEKRSPAIDPEEAAFAARQAMSTPMDPQEQRHHHNHRTRQISEDFDAAWVSLPSSTFFPPSSSSSPIRRRQHDALLDEAVDDFFNSEYIRPHKAQQGHDAFAGKEDLLPDTPSPGRLPNDVSDAFAGKEDLLPTTAASTSSEQAPAQISNERRQKVHEQEASMARRSKLIAKLRKNKATAEQQQLANASSPSTRTNKPLLSPHATDSFNGKKLISGRGRRKSKSPGRRRMSGGGGSSLTPTRRGFGKRFSRMMKPNDD